MRLPGKGPDWSIYTGYEMQSTFEYYYVMHATTSDNANPGETQHRLS